MNHPAKQPKTSDPQPKGSKIITNTAWLFGDRIARMLIGLLIGAWVTRYLGPENFGALSYAIAIASIVNSAATLGLNNTAVKAFTLDTHGHGPTIGTTSILLFLGGIGSMTIALLFAFFAIDNPTQRTLLIIISAAALFKSTESIRYWFESMTSSKHVVLVENLAIIAIASIKIILILSNASIYAFAAIISFESLLISIFLLLLYIKKGPQHKGWSVTKIATKQLLKNSLPLMVSNIAIIAYMRIDQIFIGSMIGKHENGIYSAALRLSELWYFVPMAICNSFFPTLLNLKKASPIKYEQRTRLLFEIMFLLSFSLSVATFFVAPLLIETLYGSSYRESANILRIHICGSIFLFSIVASGKLLIAEDLENSILKRHLLGALINIILNSILIPRFGATGAAYATIISFFTVAVMYNFSSRRLRHINRIQLQAVMPRECIKAIRQSFNV